jgi:hypothetical protein
VVVRIHIADSGAGVNAKHAAKTICAFIPPMKGKEENLSLRSTTMFFFHEVSIRRDQFASPSPVLPLGFVSSGSNLYETDHLPPIALTRLCIWDEGCGVLEAD